MDNKASKSARLYEPNGNNGNGHRQVRNGNESNVPNPKPNGNAGGFGCTDCRMVLPTKKVAAHHAFEQKHMRNTLCRKCKWLFDDEKACQQHVAAKHGSAARSHPVAAAAAAKVQPTTKPHTNQRQQNTTPGQSATKNDGQAPKARRGARGGHGSSNRQNKSVGDNGTPGKIPGAWNDENENVSDQNEGSAIITQVAEETSLVQQTHHEEGYTSPNPPTEVIHGRTDDSSCQGDPIATPKPFRFGLWPPPEYKRIDIEMSGQIPYEGNLYTIYAKADYDVIIEALRSRCHHTDLLTTYGVPQSKDHQPDGMGFSDSPDPVSWASRIAIPDSKKKRLAVALDCEMVGVLVDDPNDDYDWRNGGNDKRLRETSCLAQICAVDMLTGEVLINSLVWPQGIVVDYRTRYSGISREAMLDAHHEGRTLDGFREAREKLYTFIDADTVLVGHDIKGDLEVLRMAHKQIMDTSYTTAMSVFGAGPPYCGSHELSGGVGKRFPRHWGLKVLASELLSMEIQTRGVGQEGRGGRGGRGARGGARRGRGGRGRGNGNGNGREPVIGHDCLEDTLATREVALFCVAESERLCVWGTRTKQGVKEAWDRKEKKRCEKLLKQRQEKEEEQRRYLEEMKILRAEEAAKNGEEDTEEEPNLVWL